MLQVNFGGGREVAISADIGAGLEVSVAGHARLLVNFMGGGDGSQSSNQGTHNVSLRKLQYIMGCV